MGKGPVIASLLVALVLALASWVLLGRGQGGAGERRLIPVEPASVAGLEFRYPDRPVFRALPDTAGTWELRVEREGAVADSWPLVLERVQGAVRLLTTLEGDPAPGAKVDPAVTIVVSGTGGERWTVDVDRQRLSGRRLVRVDGGGRSAVFRADSALLDALVETDPSAWRDPRLLAGLSRPERVDLRSGEDRVTLVRVGETWRVVQADARADPESVDRLLSALSSLAAARFLDAPPDEPEPMGTIVVDSPRRTLIDGRMQTVTTTVRIDLGRPTLGLETVAAAVERSRAGAGQDAGPWRTGVLLARSAIEPIRRSPAAYVARRTLAVPADDVGGVDLGDVSIRRTIHGWRFEDGSALPSDAALALATLLEVLTSQRADVSLTDVERAGMITMTVRSVSGAPLEVLAIGVLDDAGEGRLITRAGRVERTYPPGAGVGALRAILSLSASPGG